jgi:glycerol-3-phosphate dehydrogenase (NAD(P)+)
MKICVLGAGAWGTALAVNAASRHQVVLWARDPAQVAAMVAQRENTRYLPGTSFPSSLTVIAGGAPSAAGSAELVIVATPMAALRDQLELLRGISVPVAWLCKGVESAQPDPYGAAAFGLLAHEIQNRVAPELRAGVLSGPSFAQEVARQQPTALVAASPHADVRDALVAAFHGPAVRVYANDDIVGVEVGGAVKNVLAIATGLCDGLALGLNARAALITRGLAEMTRFGLALGARAETFMGLSRSACCWHRATRSRRRSTRWAMWPRACTAPAPWRSGHATWASTCRSPRAWSPCSMASKARPTWWPH